MGDAKVGRETAGENALHPARLEERREAGGGLAVGLDEDLGVRVLEADRQPVRLVDVVADERVELLRGEREPLVATARADRERGRVTDAKSSRRRSR